MGTKALPIFLAIAWVISAAVGAEIQTVKEPQAVNELDYSIEYTGRLFGYFRYPNIQRTNDSGCMAADSQEAVPSRAAAEFLSHLGAKEPSRLRVAMGDNFAPEFLSVKMYDPTPPKGEKLPRFRSRDLYFPLADGSEWGLMPADNAKKGYKFLHGTVPSDNVGCFLQKAHFQVIVPGKDDFYLGPEHVSDLARFLTQPHEGLGPVQMLASNLIVSTLKHNAPKPLPVDELHSALQKVLKPPPLKGSEDPASISLPADVLPWLYEVKVKIPKEMSERKVRAELCMGTRDDPNDFLGNCSSALTLSKGSNKNTYRLSTHAATDPRHFTFRPDQNYAICLVWPDAKDSEKSERYCRPFSVRQPLLQVEPLSGQTAPVPPGDPVGIDRLSPSPYYIPDDNPNVVVFGVVDSTLMQQVGLLNYSWWNRDKSYDTTVKVTDPVDALKQVLTMCDNDARCAPIKHRILLAQMPLVKARKVVEQIDTERNDTGLFDVVITQVDGKDFTGSTSINARRHLGDPNRSHAGTSGNIGTNEPFFLVPDAHYDVSAERPLTIRLQEADLKTHDCVEAAVWDSKPGQRPDCETTNSLWNVVQEYDLDGKESNYAATQLSLFSKEVKDRFDHHGSPPFKTALEYSALDGMRKYCKADVALIQPRDVYEKFEKSAVLWSAGRSDQNLEKALYTEANLLSEVLWKGDLVVCRTLTGADLNKALTQSNGIMAQAKEGLANDDVSLVALGADRDALHGSYIIDGEPLNEKRLYSVALTDFLAYGDTGYPDLNASDLPPADTINTLKDYVLVAALAAGKREGFDSLAANDYKDDDDARSPQEPPDKTPGFDQRERFMDWIEHWQQAYQSAPTLRGPAKKPWDRVFQLQAEAQQRSYWYFNLEKMNIGYALTTINGAQQLVPVVKFGGISNVPQLQTLESQSVSVWERIHFGQVFSHWVEYFGVAETRYGFNRNRARPKGGYDPYQVSITENAFQLETGLLARRISASIPFRFLLSERLLTQFRAPLLSYSAPASGGPLVNAPSNCQVTSIDVAPPVQPNSQGSVLCAVPRSLLQETKIGTRLENQESWLEFGWESGHNFNSPLRYVFNKGTASELDCSAATNQSVTSCITDHSSAPVTASSPLYLVHQTLPVSGWFLNFKMIAPLYAKTIQFTIENYSEVFRKHRQDTSADTRFYQDTLVSLPIKIWQNLSLSPQVEMFNYQNKVLPQHFLSFTSKVTLDYNFDWHRQLTKRALGFPDPNTVTKSSTLPLP